MPLNPFSSLAKYNSATNENYLTESLVFVARLLLERCPEDGVVFLNLLCGQHDEAFFNDAKKVTISTQVTTDSGSPDIKISDGKSIVYIEVKHDSPLGFRQLERYKDELAKSTFINSRLVLLTRSKFSFIETTLGPGDYSHIYWYEIFNWLSNLDMEEDVCNYFVEKLMEFLAEKKMSLQKVSPEYQLGIPALLALIDMLRIALIEVLPGEKISKTSGWTWRGFYLPRDYWCGILFANPLIVTFENNKGISPVTYRRCLDLLESDFFSFDKDRQFECLTGFLRSSIKNMPVSE